ncbi:hypothetical protein EVAR_44787_1 [Eumeta japonica]|uniref:Uncharacterized protein n=1 Tax=Eumeta variegata TaxID=151549 RepID=A0A4C1Y9W2_EUMVA|nr:hypothetical protein EVAR_44787_1 [Eumeta japonica]
MGLSANKQKRFRRPRGARRARREVLIHYAPRPAASAPPECASCLMGRHRSQVFSFRCEPFPISLPRVITSFKLSRQLIVFTEARTFVGPTTAVEERFFNFGHEADIEISDVRNNTGVVY